MAQITPKAKKDGSTSYLIRVYAGRTQDDKVITKCKTVTPPAGMGKKKAEKWVQEQAVLFEQQVTNGLVLDSDMLLDDLIDRWFEEYANKQLKAKTLYDYRRMRGRISAGLGHLKVSKIRPAHVMAFYNNLEEKGVRRDSTYTAIKALLNLLPYGTRGELAKQAGIGQLALLLGARRGEICALRWSDIDFEKGTLSIKRTVQFIPGTGLLFNTPKTRRGKRCLRIGADCVELLQEYRRYQKAERFRIGSAWVRKVTLENGKVVDNDMLFTKWNGEPMDPDIISSWFSDFLEEHGLPDVNFHSLRHSNASILIAAHVPITTVSGRLGHAQTSTTLNYYASAIQSADAAAADALEGVIRIRERAHA